MILIIVRLISMLHFAKYLKFSIIKSSLIVLRASWYTGIK